MSFCQPPVAVVAAFYHTGLYTRMIFTKKVLIEVVAFNHSISQRIDQGTRNCLVGLKIVIISSFLFPRLQTPNSVFWQTERQTEYAEYGEKIETGGGKPILCRETSPGGEKEEKGGRRISITRCCRSKYQVSALECHQKCHHKATRVFRWGRGDEVFCVLGVL